MRLLAIDPGNVESAYVVIDEYRQPLVFDKVGNFELLDMLRYERLLQHPGGRVVIEMVASYGMAVGADVFETCVWIGTFQEALQYRGREVDLIKRHPVKMHLCHDPRAKDSNITQALIDRFAPGAPNRGKGTKATPGFFHGFRADIWQAYALAVYAADALENGEQL